MLRLVRDPKVRSLDDGTVLLGGSPLRVFRLSDAGARMVERWWGGEAVAASNDAQRLASRLIDVGMAHPRYDEAPYGPADVTAVVPVRDDEVDVAAFADLGAMVVVDDGSSAPVVASGARVVRRTHSGGPGAARNEGMAQVNTPLVAFVDADTLPREGWLEPLLHHFADERVMAVAPRVVSAAGTSVLARYDERHSPLDMGPDEGVVRALSRVSYVPAAALVARRDIPRFDEGLRFGEDVDLVWRLGGDGWVIRYEPASILEHRPRSTWATWLRQRFGYGTSAAPLATRHPEAVTPLAVSGWSAAAWAATATIHPVVGKVSPKTG